MTKKNQTAKRALCAVLALAMLIGGTFAYFSDYASTQVKGTAGTVAVAMDSDINLLDAEGRDILNPGDMRDGSFSVTNEGNKSIDVRTTIAVTAVDHAGNAIDFTGSATEQSEYDLYAAEDVELVEGEGYAPKAGAQPLQVKSINGNTITYVLPEYSLNGNSDKYDEVETIDGVDTFTQDNEFVFLFKGASENKWQASGVSIDVLVEAKQHENTGAGWDIVAQENVSIGAINQSAVKGENVITTPDGAYNGIITFALINDDTDAGIPNVTMTLVKLPESSTVSAVDTLGGTVIRTVRSNAEGEGEFGRLAPGTYALVSPNFQLTEEAKNLIIIGVDGADHYEWRGSMDWAATIGGTVTDEAGDPVVDAEVNVLDQDKDFVAGSTTDENGDFVIYPIVEGDYKIEVEGFDSVVDDEVDTTITVQSGETTDNSVVVTEKVEDPTDTPELDPDEDETVTAPSHILRDYSFMNVNPIPTDATKVIFTNEAVPAGYARVEGVDMSDPQDDSIWLYSNGTTEYYVATPDGGEILANPNSNNLFKNYRSLTAIEFESFDTSNTTTMESMFYGCTALQKLDLSGFNTENVQYMSNMFNTNGNTPSLTEIDMSGWDTSSLTSTMYMFKGQSKLTTLDLSSWTVDNISSANYMFAECTRLVTIYANDWTYNSNISTYSNTRYMFDQCVKLVGSDGAVAYSSSDASGRKANPTTGYFQTPINSVVYSYQLVDKNTFNTNYVEGTTSITFTNTPVPAGVETFGLAKASTSYEDENSIVGYYIGTDMYVTAPDGGKIIAPKMCNSLFEGKASLTSIVFDNFDTSATESFTYMFYGCTGLTELDLTGFDVSTAQSVSGSYAGMFQGCTNLKTIYAGDWTGGTAAYSDNVFYGCTSLVGAVSYNDSKVKGTMANPTTGYFTAK